MNRSLLSKVSLIAGLGGLLYGYDMGIIAAAMVFLRTSFHLSTGAESWVVSTVLIGAMAGALSGGALADALGRRPTMMAGAVLFVVGSTLAMLAPNVAAIIVARALLGIAVGFNSVTAPIYVSELAPPQSRGTLVGLYQFTLTCGIALADLAGYWLAAAGNWRLMFGLGAIPALLFLLLVFGVPESPRWLLGHGHDSEAVAILESYAGTSGASAILEDLRAGLRTVVERRWTALLAPAARRGLLVAVGYQHGHLLWPPHLLPRRCLLQPERHLRHLRNCRHERAGHGRRSGPGGPHRPQAAALLGRRRYDRIAFPALVGLPR
jgi:MFS family permease